ncbi:hypothetical protein GOODEAATRI_003849 [Goodea atripinnis]|uniref:Uncharacterized protein n=1 Tax=Goodea atripinnis TaxID=208336 RepID=A0ABV0PB41_9TELE
MISRIPTLARYLLQLFIQLVHFHLVALLSVTCPQGSQALTLQPLVTQGWLWSGLLVPFPPCPTLVSLTLGCTTLLQEQHSRTPQPIIQSLMVLLASQWRQPWQPPKQDGITHICLHLTLQTPLTKVRMGRSNPLHLHIICTTPPPLAHTSSL